MRKVVVLSLVTLCLAAIPLDRNGIRASGSPQKTGKFAGSARTATPIKHIVIIFQENVSFDHYFGAYPNAANPPQEPRFHALLDTPAVNGFTPGLLARNPNFMNKKNGTGAANPFRLDRSQAHTADQDHAYRPEQLAFDAGLMDLFPLSVGAGGPPAKALPGMVTTTALTMGYYDGNTVTALWNYAQHFAMNDNSYGTTFGPSTPGAINLISGQTNGVAKTRNGTGDETDGGDGSLTLIGDADPIGDVCSSPTRAQAAMGGANIGDLLTRAGITWGWFEGGFDLGVINPNGTTGCNRRTTSPYTRSSINDYSPHHEPFQYYASTANPSHARPTSLLSIGHAGDPANHQYGMHDFFDAVRAGSFPSVSFLKAPAIDDGHAGYSSPLDEQNFMVRVIDFLEQQPDWRDTLVVIAYDDSDGWYDHQMGPIMNQSSGTADALTGPGACGNGNTSLPGISAGNLHATGRCGYGPRLPLLAISPYARPNFVSHSLTDQSSIIHFIEDNWLGGQRIGQGSFDAIAGSIQNMLNYKQSPTPKLFLNPETGEPR
ncbi:MAG TPA: alkaline phosphatase family protein [Terriglobia bacterium]|nr:alkaline phosphatase family protein [Terriglobia bacterium]